MPRTNTQSSSYSTGTTSFPGQTNTTSTSRLGSGRIGTARPRTGGRPRTAASARSGSSQQQIICAISESRGVSPTVGLAFVNLSTAEAVLCQICDNQHYARLIHKLLVFDPSQILIMSTAGSPKSKMYSIVEENLVGTPVTLLDRKYWAETTGIEYITQLAPKEDIEALKVAVGGNYFAICCIAATLKYIELALSITFSFHSLRIKYEPSEGSMFIDLSTISSLELIQNLQDVKSRDCLYGLLNQTQTPMGSRLLRSNILQPLTEVKTLESRFDALEELTTKEDMFFAARQAMQSFVDVDRLLTALIIIPTKQTVQTTEQAINNVVILKAFVNSVAPVFEALTGARTELLKEIRELCAPAKIDAVQQIINRVMNDDITYSSHPLDLRNQRTYAIKSGVNGLLDVARQTYKEANADVYQMVSELGQNHELALELKFDNSRQFYLRFAASEIEGRLLPADFINVFRKGSNIDCQTLDLVKRNQKILDSHVEVLLMTDKAVQDLIEEIREEISLLFKVSEGIAMLDLIASFAQLVTTQNYVRPEFTETIAIKQGRHPVWEKVHADRYIPNDVYATQQTRLQIITGCNMSGKSTYIRSIALMAVMAQIGCFVPAQYASFVISRQLFARVSLDDSIEANISTFAAEMRETAFILRNIEKQSMVIIDELGRGTSTRDGLAIALAVAEALIDSRALVWFATHFRDLATILSERNGVVNMHLAVEITEENTMNMLYTIAEGQLKDEHYGLALARVVALPESVLELATKVSDELARRSARRKKSSQTFAINRRRKLILNLQESLMQAKSGPMHGQVLSSWLRKLQEEFVLRMDAIEAEAQAAALCRDEEEDEGDESPTEQEGLQESETNNRQRSVESHSSSWR